MNLKAFGGVFAAWLAVAGMADAQSWTPQGIGSLGVTGSAVVLGSNGFTVWGSGTDIGGVADACEFVFQALPGDGQIVAQLKSAPTSDPWSKAGVMIRESLSSVVRNATLVVSRDNGVELSVRKSASGSTVADVILAGRAAPQWLKLIRSGTNFSAYISSDGASWGLVGTDTVSIAGSAYVGMAVTSHKNTVLGSAEFANVAVTQGPIVDVSNPQAPCLVYGAKSSSSLAISWSAAADDVGVVSYLVKRDGVVVATLPGTTISYLDNGLTPSASYTYTVTAVDASGKSSDPSNSVTVTSDPAATGALSVFQDIGAVGKAGSASYDAASATYTLQGAGDIAGVTDALQFGLNPCNGNTAIVVHIGSVQNTNASAKAGAMIRESLDANAREASILLTASNGVVFQSRAATSGSTLMLPAYAYPSTSNRRSPQWVKLVRHGDDFKGYVSADGVAWEYVGGSTIAMAPTAYAGLATSSHASGVLCSAVFTNLSISASVDGASPSSPSGLNISGLSDVSLSLSWIASIDDVAVDGYEIFQDGIYVGNTPFVRFTDTFQDPASSHVYTVQAVDVEGNLSPASNSVSVTLQSATLPSPWIHDDIGLVDRVGSASLNGGTFGISGAGTDINGAGGQDAFHYIYQPLTSDLTITARVASIPNPPNTSLKAGVMIRESLEPGARNAMFLVVGGSGASLQFRANPDTTGTSISGDSKAKTPYWVKLVRGGSRFAGYQSADGANWTLAGSCTVPMGTQGYIGLALTSHDPRVLANATFDNVQISADSDSNRLPDAWELTWFNKIGMDPNAPALRGDGLTVLQAYQQGLNPIDYFDGGTPLLTKISGDGQNGAINTFLAEPLVFRISDSAGNAFANVPVTVSVTSGGGLVALDAAGSSAAASQLFHSDANGLVNVYYKEGAAWGASVRVSGTAGKSAIAFTATASPQVGHWPMDTHTGSNTPDTSKTGNTATAVGGIAWGVGFDGKGDLALDGLTGYLEVPATADFALGSGPMTVTAWVRLPKNIVLDNESQIYPLITYNDGNADALSMCVRGGGHGLQTQIKTTSGVVAIDVASALNMLTDGYWHQVGLVYDGTSVMSVYLDGTVATSQLGIQMAAVASPHIWLGKDGAGHFFGGEIDELEVRRDALPAANVLARYNVDNDGDTVPDAWEWRNFGTLNYSGSSDTDGDGVNNAQEYKNGTNPCDYYNGFAPVITKVNGDNQNGMPGAFLMQKFTVLVSDATGKPLSNAPVTFSVVSGGGLVSASTSGGAASVTLRTGTDGRIGAYLKLGSGYDSNQVQCAAGKSWPIFFNATVAPLVAQWKFEEGQGISVADGSLTANSLTLKGAASWTVGYDGRGAIALDGTTGYLASAPGGAFSMSASSALTLATWICVPSGTPLAHATDVYPIATFGTSSTDSLAFLIQGCPKGPQFVINTGSAQAIATFDASAIADSQWHHIAFVSDGHGNLSMVFDGHLVSQIAVGLPYIATPRICLGRDAAGHCFSGGFDDTIIRRDALSLADVQAIYNTGAENGGLPNWWKWRHFGTLDVDPNATADGTIQTNLQAYQADINPVVAVAGIPGLPAERGIAGQVLWERWSGPELKDTYIEDIRRFGKYPAQPNETYTLPNFEITPDKGVACTASRLRAYLTAPTTGAYRFYITGQDVSYFYLSPSDRSYERQLAVSWTWVARDTWTQASGCYYLKAGSRYYVEAYIKGETHAGYGQVGWTTPADSNPKVIPGTYLVSMGAEDDTNDVGMPDTWQMTHIGALAQRSNLDLDGDGLTNLQEFQFGTDPLSTDTGSTGIADAGKQAGHLSYDYWLNISGTSATDFIATSRYLQGPDGRVIIDGTTEPSVLSRKYASVMRGYFVPLLSGTYGFQANAGGDGVAAYLSTDSNPANRTLLFSKTKNPATRVLTAGQRYYLEIVHKMDEGTPAASFQWMMPGATAYGNAAVTQLVPLNAPGIAAQAALPIPWQRTDINVNRGWLTYPGLSTIDANGNLEIEAAGKSSYLSHSDGMHMVYQLLPDGGQIQARFLGCDFLNEDRSGRTAGLIVRQNLESGSPQAMLRLTGDGRIYCSCRIMPDAANVDSVDTLSMDGQAITYTGPIWLRLVRDGKSVYAYTSLDGTRWSFFDVVDLNLDGPAFIGVFASSGTENQFCRAEFDHLSAGIDPTIALKSAGTDTDGDGYTDYEETQFLHSDPLVNDLQPATTVANLDGKAGRSAIGTWSTDGSAIYNIGVRGAVDYTAEIPQDGIFRIAIQGAPRVNTTSDTSWNVIVSIDDQYLETVRYELALGQTGIAEVFTPWLKAGSHKVRLYLDNYSIYRSFAFTSLQIQSIPGADANQNGIPDWMETRMAALDGITSVASQSRTSPFCLEGTAYFQQTAKLTANGAQIPLLQSVGDGWYANVPLDSGAPVAVSAEFENGGKVDQKSITWLPTRVINSDVPNNTLTIRKGDALLLRMAPDGAASGTGTIAISLPDQTTTTIQTSGTELLQYNFADSGTYTLNASYTDGINPIASGTFIVRVMEAAFTKPDPEVAIGYAREWLNPQLSPDTVIESDSRMEVLELPAPAGGGRDLRLRLDAPEKRVLLARLNDGTQTGPILDRAVVTGIEACAGSQTGIYVVNHYSDGSQLVEMRLILSGVPADLRVRLSIFATGVTFEDGSIEKWLTAADFDAQGQVKVRFIMAPHSYTSICHRIYLYQGDTVIECRKN